MTYLRLCAIAAVLAAASAAPSSGPTAHLASGTVVGSALEVSTAPGSALNDTSVGEVKPIWEFLGIPYAAAPVGDLRFAPPAPVTPWSGVRDATKYGDMCWQAEVPDANTGMSEDCLYINVWTPPVTSGETDQALMVFIHGGTFKTGAGSFPMYNGAKLAAATGNVVVTLNYRLNVFGYLGASWLRGLDTKYGSTGNTGMQDQRAALQWVQTNARAFGADPQKVFAFGESAGGASVSNHMVMEHSGGLFRAAGIESGSAAPWTSQPLDVAEGHADAIADAVGCPASLGHARAKCMQGVSAATLEKQALVHYDMPPLQNQWAPVVDFVELRNSTLHLTTSGKFSFTGSVLLGNNKHEGWLFNYLPKDISEEDIIPYFHQVYGTTLAPKVIDYYTPAKYGTPWLAFSAALTDQSMACPARNSAFRTVGVGMPTYRYVYEHENEVATWGCTGACHGAELAFVFNYGPHMNVEKEGALVPIMQGYWGAFAKTMDPNLQSSKVYGWPKFASAGGGAELLINVEQQTGTNYDAANCELWFSSATWNGSTDAPLQRSGPRPDTDASW